MRNIFVLFVLLSTGQGSSITFQAILDRARQRTLSGISFKKSRSCTADHDALIRDLVTSHSENESLSNLYKVFETFLAHLGMDAMAEASFNDRAGTLRSQLRRLPSNTITTQEASKPSDPEFCIIENDPKCSARELDKRRKLDTDSNFARSMLDNDDADMGESGQETIEALENQDMLISSSEDLAMAKKDDSTLLNANLDNGEIYRMVLGRARQRMETQPTSSRRCTKYTLAHDQVIMDVVNYFKSAGSYRQYEILNQLTADLGMLKMEWTTFTRRASQARKQTGDSSKQNRREPKIGSEASNILGSILDENPRISMSGAWKALESKLQLPHNGDLPMPSMSGVRNWVEYTRGARRFVDIQQLNIEGIIGDAATEEEERCVRRSSKRL